MSSLFQPRVLLRLEGGALLVLSVLLYGQASGEWLLFAVLLLFPDLSMMGYLAGTRVGAAMYNLLHTYPLPFTVLAYGLLAHNSLALQVALIWLAHIGMDRLVGYGLKYPEAFKETHLNRV